MPCPKNGYNNNNPTFILSMYVLSVQLLIYQPVDMYKTRSVINDTISEDVLDTETVLNRDIVDVHRSSMEMDSDVSSLYSFDDDTAIITHRTRIITNDNLHVFKVRNKPPSHRKRSRIRTSKLFYSLVLALCIHTYKTHLRIHKSEYFS